MPNRPLTNPGVRNYRTGLFKVARFAHGLQCSEVMTNAWFYQPEVFQQRPEPGYIVTSLLTAAVEPLVEYLSDMVKEIMQALVVAPDTIVLPVSP